MSPEQNKAQHVPYFTLFPSILHHDSGWKQTAVHQPLESCDPGGVNIHQKKWQTEVRGRIYIILLCSHAEYYFAQPEVRQNLSFVQIKALALLPSQADLHFMKSVTSKVHCLINEQCGPQKQKSVEKCQQKRKKWENAMKPGSYQLHTKDHKLDLQLQNDGAATKTSQDITVWLHTLCSLKNMSRTNKSH